MSSRTGRSSRGPRPPLPWDQLAYGLVGTIALAALGVLYVTTMLRTFRQRGYVTRFS